MARGADGGCGGRTPPLAGLASLAPTAPNPPARACNLANWYLLDLLVFLRVQSCYCYDKLMVATVMIISSIGESLKVIKVM